MFRRMIRLGVPLLAVLTLISLATTAYADTFFTASLDKKVKLSSFMTVATVTGSYECQLENGFDPLNDGGNFNVNLTQFVSKNRVVSGNAGFDPSNGFQCDGGSHSFTFDIGAQSNGQNAVWKKGKAAASANGNACNQYGDCANVNVDMLVTLG